MVSWGRWTVPLTLSSWGEWYPWFEQTGRNILKLFYSIEIYDMKEMIKKTKTLTTIRSDFDSGPYPPFRESLWLFNDLGLHPLCRRRIKAVSAFLCTRLLHAHLRADVPLNWL